MAKGFAHTLKTRRKKGPSAQEQMRGPNTGAWEKTWMPNRQDQGFKRAIADHRVDSMGKNRVKWPD